MAQSLFDNRYRYDFIYPRGRSGETLRAYDTYHDDQAVVIKRPAPNDAPPIRAGQEVSIGNERRALQQLAGHPVLTELLADGQFLAAGIPHQYIVMERAEGVIIADDVTDLSANGERLPELEMLVIVDHLLDLLHAAHRTEIVYNDVDAKHLFWNREQYRLKVIDWGNAVFLEGDEITQQGISRQTDIFQVGELLYFLVTGGRRADVPRDADEHFMIDFGDDARRIPSRLQAIISKALHPNAKLRYPNITALRNDLTNYRSPLERERNSAVATILTQLKRPDLPMSELRQLQEAVMALAQRDPGYPPTREALNTIEDRLRDLSVEADLDAVKIYMLNSNWQRSSDLLRELRQNAGTKTGELSNLLLDYCVLLIDHAPMPTPSVILEAIEQLFQQQYSAAATTLLRDSYRATDRDLRWRLAERISSHMTDVLLLRPNVYRLAGALSQMQAEGGYVLDEARQLLGDIQTMLDQMHEQALDLSLLRDRYRTVVDKLSELNPLLQTFAAQHELSVRRVPLNALERALNAAMALADNMHVIGKQATANPREARQALATSYNIDPTNPLWDDVDALLTRLYDRLQACQTYVPAADGSDLQDWFKTTHDKLHPFQTRLFDDMLDQMVTSLAEASETWDRYQAVILSGNRDQSVATLERASQAVSTISPALSQWFRQVRTVIDGAQYIERHALPGGLGRALADGWAAFDGGRLSEAERLGQQAQEIARSEAARFAASRLQAVSRISHDWVERNGVASAERSRTHLEAIQGLFTAEENALRADFEAQMPSIETYLKAMSKGLVSTFYHRNTAALRLLFMYYLLQGTLDVHEGLLEDGQFWRDAAINTLTKAGEQHIATRTLNDYIAHRYDLIQANQIFSQINGKHILPELGTMRRQLDNNAQAKRLAPAIQSLRDVEVALRDWSDGDFRAAGLKLNEAVRGIDQAEKEVDLDLAGYRAWLMDLMEQAATLTVQARDMRSMIERRPDQPDGTIRAILDGQVQMTEQRLGSQYSATLRQWRDTFVQFVDILESDVRRSKRLEQLNELFRALFIDQHPAYPLYRHWYTVLEAQSEFAAPPTDDPTPRQESSADIPEIVYRNPEDAISPDVLPPRRPTRSLKSYLLYGGGILAALLVVALLGTRLFGGSDVPSVTLTISATPNEGTLAAWTAASQEASGLIVAQATATATAAIVATTIQPTASQTIDIATNTIVPTIDPTTLLSTATPSATATETATATPTIPTDTPTPSATPTVTYTPSITPTVPLPTLTPLPESGLAGRQDVIALLNRSRDVPFNRNTFFSVEGGYQIETDAASDTEAIQISLSDSFLEAAYGNNAANRITSIETEISLLTFNPALRADEPGVHFGIRAESAQDGNNIGLRIGVIDESFINIFEMQNGVPNLLSLRSVGAVIVRLRIDRDLDTGNVLLFLNDEQLQSAPNFFAADAPIVPVLTVRDGGVSIRVTNWHLTLR